MSAIATKTILRLTKTYGAKWAIQDNRACKYKKRFNVVVNS